MTDREADGPAPAYVFPALVDLRLVAGLVAAEDLAFGTVGLVVAVLVGDSDGWTIAAFAVGGLLSLAFMLRQQRRSPASADLVVAPASAPVESALETSLRVFLGGAVLLAVTVAIVLLDPVIGAVLAGWVIGLGLGQIVMLSRLRRWEEQHGLHLRGGREKGLRSLRAPRELIAQSRR